jgi:hypothetical protein
MNPLVRRPVAVAASAVLATAGALAVVAPPAQAATPVRIVKIWYDSPGTDNRSTASLNAEYVVLKNVTTSARTITGWTVRDAAGHRYTFGTLQIGAGRTVVLHTGRGTNTSTNRYWQSGNYIWNNDRDTAYLRDARGALMQTCAYNSTKVDYRIC